MRTKSNLYTVGNSKEIENFASLKAQPHQAEVNITDLLAREDRPYAPTAVERLFTFLGPFFKYVFSLRPAIPNIIYMLISIGAMQLIKMKGILPDVEWLQPALFFALLTGISIQLMFASAKSITIPLVTICISAFAIWAHTTHGASLPIAKEIFQYLIVLGTAGIVVSTAFNP